MREALIVWGGWAGHEPEECAAIIREMLESEGLRGLSRAFDRGFRRPLDP